MTAPTTTELLKYADLQMAAEAFLVDGDTVKTGRALTDALLLGNKHASRFTATQADAFLDPTSGWTVLAQKPNTATGFSGTLFKNNKTGELVMSMRSTEFIDDAARDNQATNVLEVREFGWAFGQIDDMKQWVDGLYASGKIPSASPVSVTGYSLGGHLATAFNLLYPGVPQATYTFNGAGVGKVNSGSLTQVIAQFDRQRTNASGNEITFTDPQATIFYNQMRAKLIGGVAPSLTDIENATLLVANVGEARLLRTALERIKSVTDEVTRLKGITGSGPSVSEIDATKLDYQLAALLAGRNTSSVRTNVALGGWDAYAGRNPAPGGAIPNFYDVYGAAPPSAVANSQLHYGTLTPVFIEDLQESCNRTTSLPDGTQSHQIRLQG